MKGSAAHLAPSTGAAMDTIIPRKKGRKLLISLGGVLLLALLALGLWRLAPRGLQVAAVDVRSARVEAGVFSDDIVVRGKAEALESVVLDSVETGRVDQILVRDGAMVKQGEILFRISNPQRNLELLQRQSEHTQQISNLSNLRVEFEVGKTDHARRADEIAFNLEQAQKKLARDSVLAQRDFISGAVLTESSDALAKWKLQKEQEARRERIESDVKRDALVQMERAIKNIERGLTLVSATVDALVVRAPASGRLTDFNLQVGAAVRSDQHIGRIDDPSKFKLTAQVDEFYLNRIRVGQQGMVRQGGQDYQVAVIRILPQVKDGRFSIELGFKDAHQDNLSPGQSMDAQITLGQSSQALLLPNAPFLSDSGGAWVYTLAANGVDAEKRLIRTGRRNNRQIEVLSGLRAGEQVIISSYAAFGDASHLQLSK
jgi:HlyD family secretion protein